MDTQLTQLAKLREPFPEHQISKLPRMTKQQKEDKNNHAKCEACGGWHHRNAQHLDYVGHAALTCRLLDVDPMWTWMPFATAQDGSPLIDKRGGMWINLTICGVTRPGYGCAEMREGKEAGNLVKELIGDALRNAGMRFGMALDLWHKGDLHKDEDEPRQPQRQQEHSYEPRQSRQYQLEERAPQRQPQREYDNDPETRDYDEDPPHFPTDAEKIAERQVNRDQSDWRKFLFPIPGDKKNTPLWKLSDKDLWYWIDNYKPKAQYPDNLRFREALDAARAELGGESDVAVQQRNPPAPARQPQSQQAQSHVPAADEEDIPF